MKKTILTGTVLALTLFGCKKSGEDLMSNEVPGYSNLKTDGENYFDRHYNENEELIGCYDKEILDCLVSTVEPQIPPNAASVEDLDSDDLKDYLLNEFSDVDDFSSEQGQILIADILNHDIYAIEFSSEAGHGFFVIDSESGNTIYTVLIE